MLKETHYCRSSGPSDFTKWRTQFSTWTITKNVQYDLIIQKRVHTFSHKNDRPGKFEYVNVHIHVEKWGQLTKFLKVKGMILRHSWCDRWKITHKLAQCYKTMQMRQANGFHISHQWNPRSRKSWNIKYHFHAITKSK